VEVQVLSGNDRPFASWLTVATRRLIFTATGNGYCQATEWSWRKWHNGSPSFSSQPFAQLGAVPLPSHVTRTLPLCASCNFASLAPP